MAEVASRAGIARLGRLSGRAAIAMPSLLGAACLGGLQPAFAGRPLFTDDATVTPAGACQFESWYQDNPSGHELNLAPACNLFGDVELTLGYTRRDPDAQSAANSYSLQGKTVFKELKPDGWGWGFAAGAVHQSGLPQSRSVSDLYFYLPLTLSFASDRYQLHLNAGANHHRQEDVTAFTWGLGAVAALNARLSTFAEVFGSDDVPTIHGGLSLPLMPDLLQLDLTIGRTLSGVAEGNFASVGLNAYLPPFAAE